jgi:hypothetical protein
MCYSENKLFRCAEVTDAKSSHLNKVSSCLATKSPIVLLKLEKAVGMNNEENPVGFH